MYLIWRFIPKKWICIWSLAAQPGGTHSCYNPSIQFNVDIYLRIASILVSIFLATKQLKLFYKVRFRITIHCFIVLPVIKWKGITIVGTDDSRGEMLRVLTITSLKRWNISYKENKVVERGCGVEQTPFFSFQVPHQMSISQMGFLFLFFAFFPDK